MAVYFIQDDGGEIKIGWSEGNPYRRLNAFRTGNPRELKLLVSIPGGREEEQALHDRFADLRTRGEWFKPDARLLGFIEGMRYAHADNQPEPVADTSDALSLEQLQVSAGYTFVTSVMIRAGGITNAFGGPLHDSLRTSALDCVGLLSVAKAMMLGNDAYGIGARESTSEEDVEDLIGQLKDFIQHDREAVLAMDPSGGR